MKHTTPDSMKFKRLCRRLGMTPVVAAGTLELLWIATARNAPPGDIGRFSNEDIAIQVYWEGDADELVEALVETGWLDLSQQHRLVVHDWHEHAPRYIHAWMKSKGLTFASCSPAVSTTGLTTVQPIEPPIEATAVATIEGGIPNLTVPNLTVPLEDSHMSGKPDACDKASKDAAEVLEHWNRAMGQQCRWTDKRLVAFRQRWKSPFWRENWQQAIQRAASSSFCRGERGDGWAANFEWFLKPDTVTKLLEGNYDDREAKPKAKPVTFGQQRQQNTLDLLERLKAQEDAAATGVAGFIGEASK